MNSIGLVMKSVFFLNFKLCEETLKARFVTNMFQPEERIFDCSNTAFIMPSVLIQSFLKYTFGYAHWMIYICVIHIVYTFQIFKQTFIVITPYEKFLQSNWIGIGWANLVNALIFGYKSRN